MTDYAAPDTGANVSPFFSYREEINRIVIEEGVTSVGAFSFSGCNSVTGISLPEGLEYIESGAFGGTSAAGIVFPESLKEIHQFAFQGCLCLESVRIPSQVRYIHHTAFSQCIAVTAYEVDENNLYFSDVDGVLFDKSGSRLLRFPGARGGTYVIPDTVEALGYYAFEYAVNLEEVTIPDSVETMAPLAFAGCSSLASVSIPGSVSLIEYRDFYECTSLRSVTIGNGIAWIADDAFAGDRLLQYVELPLTVESIGGYAFARCENLKGILIPAGVTGFGDRIFDHTMSWLTIYGTAGSAAETYAEENWIDFMEVDGKCGENVYWAMDSQAGDLMIFGSGPMYEYATSHSPFYGRSDIVSVTILEGVTRIGENAFFNCQGLSELELPWVRLETIGAGAFRNCVNLTRIFIPSGIRTIERYAFKGCTNLEQAYFAGDKIPSMAFGETIYDKTDKLTVYCRLGTMAYVDAVRRQIPYYLVDPFGGAELALPFHLLTVEDEAFAGLNVRSIYVDQYVTSIGSRAFADNMTLEKVLLPDSLTYIAEDAFEGCRRDLMIYGHRGTLVEEYAARKGYYFALAPVG